MKKEMCIRDRGFDYLRDNMVTDVKDRVLRGLHVAIVDEVDSILVDESRTPLIISGGAKKTANLYLQADAFAKRLKGDDFEIDEKTRQIMLSEKGVSVTERYFKIKNLYDVDHTQLVHHITPVSYTHLVYAACGTGKTELVMEAIKQSLAKGCRVGFAISRRQVVLEIRERMQDAFKNLNVIAVCEGYTEVTEGDLCLLYTSRCV